MNDFTSLLQQGNAWLFIPSAILLGALHGLEPGHSKTMMASISTPVNSAIRCRVLMPVSLSFAGCHQYMRKIIRAQREKTRRLGKKPASQQAAMPGEKDDSDAAE